MLQILHSLLLLTRLLLLGDQDDDERGPSSCLQTSTTLVGLVTCLDGFTVPHDYYTPLTYNLAQPAGTQRDDWTAAVRALLAVDGNCSTTRVPLSLRGLYAIAPFQEHCILYESSASCGGVYLKGWGFMAVPARRAQVARHVHVSAPHPGYDLGTVEQAAAVYDAAGASSLLVAGRTRTAFLEESGCIQQKAGKQPYYKTDPAHNDEEPFVDASIAIYHWQDQHHGCPSASCAFLQFHGKAATTCAADTIFLSSGLGNSSASKAWYRDATDRPVKRLQKNLQLAFSSPSSSPSSFSSSSTLNKFNKFKVSLPSDSPCPLTATTNVVGRALNGVPLSALCGRAASSRHATGVFVQAEQAARVRGEGGYKAWAGAVVRSFEGVGGGDGAVDGSGTERGEMGEMDGMEMGGRVGRGGRTGERMIMDRLVWHPWYVSVCYFMML